MSEGRLLKEYIEAFGYEVDEEMIEEVFAYVDLADGQEVTIEGPTEKFYAKGPGRLYVVFIPREG